MFTLWELIVSIQLPIKGVFIRYSAAAGSSSLLFQSNSLLREYLYASTQTSTKGDTMNRFNPTPY